jgi:hypothetical protein
MVRSQLPFGRARDVMQRELEASATATANFKAEKAEVEQALVAKVADVEMRLSRELANAARLPAATSSSDTDFLRKKLSEKEARIDTLVCERNSLTLQVRRLEEREHDIERGLGQGKPKTAQKDKGPPTLGSFVDDLMRAGTRVVAGNARARMLVFGYVLLLHLWTFFFIFFSG